MATGASGRNGDAAASHVNLGSSIDSEHVTILHPVMAASLVREVMSNHSCAMLTPAQVGCHGHGSD